MTDRYRGYPPASRAATFDNPRSSMPSSAGYDVPSSSRVHPVTTPRAYTTATTASGVPTTTRTYAVSSNSNNHHDARSRSTYEGGRSRRQTLDSTMRPPPVIVTTTAKDRDRSRGPRTGSPVRNAYRTGDGKYYAQPASTIRSRSAARPYHSHSASEDHGRPRDRTDGMLSARDADAYRNTRPSVVYPSDPRHSTAAIDYDNDGYQYTNAGELVRYDLDQNKPARPRRHDSVDRGYYRPNINYNADQRSLNVNTSHDLSRNYNMNTSRPYQGVRGGPSSPARGFEKYGRGYDSSRDVPPAAPAPPAPAPPPAQVEVAGAASDRRKARGERPVSLYQDADPRSSHHDDYYRSRDDERGLREHRDRDRDHHHRDRDLDRASAAYHDPSVTSRGFGIRTSPPTEFEDRREYRHEPRKEESRRRSDEDPVRGSDIERDDRRRSRQVDDRREKRESKRGSDQDDDDRTRLRDKVASSVGVAAAAVGLGPFVKPDDKRDDRRDKDDKRERDDRESKSRRSPDGGRERQGADVYERSSVPSKDRDSPRDRDHEGARYDARERPGERDGDATVQRHRQDAEARLTGGAVAAPSLEAEDHKEKATRRSRHSAAFDPNDTSDLKELKEQMAAMDNSQRTTGRERSDSERSDKDRSSQTRERPAATKMERSRSSSVSKEYITSEPSSMDDDRGRELVVQSPGSRQVRVVSPPRDDSNDKPLKGILKHPKSSFPEDRNPIREGVAPHKEDKKAKETPPGARWTKINRKIVNPEALTVGKERFEVRDDFVIVLRVLSKEEIQAYAAATQVLRGMTKSPAV